MENEYLTATDLGALIRKDAQAVYYMRHCGDAPIATKIGKRLLFHRDDVKAWLAAQRETPRGRPKVMG